ncbi:hypothetical protein AB3S75_000910 [Citrus x aurantiifolia]
MKMEKRSPGSYPHNNNKFKLNLKNLPPIDPYSITSTKSHQVNYEIPSWRIAKQMPKEETTKSWDDDVALFCLTKHIDPNSTSSVINNIETSGYDYEDDRVYENESKNEVLGAPNKVSAKSKLLEICAANHWKPPLFDCCQEEGPCHRKLFTFKVTFEIESLNTILECFGAPQSKKKTAAEHAAEGALWYLERLGYFPIRKLKK